MGRSNLVKKKLQIKKKLKDEPEKTEKTATRTKLEIKPIDADNNLVFTERVQINNEDMDLFK